MPTDCLLLRQYFEKSSKFLDSNQIYKFNENTFALIRIPKKSKTNNQSRLKELEKRLGEVSEKLKFSQENYERRFSDLPTFLKICYFFSYYDSKKRTCSCKTFANRAICKHQLASEVYLNRMKNPYQEKVAEGARVGRPRNLQ